MRLKYVLFALTPTLVLLVGAEVLVRAAILARPSLLNLPLPGEGSLLVPDADLLWSLRPSHREKHFDVDVITNELGLRSPPLEARTPEEFRILSLGESTTFGSKVTSEQTYTQLLAKRLDGHERAAGGRRHFTAINAGVPAYSSFQSLEYLMRRGLQLEPDLLVVYHEANDYLPSSVRDSRNNELGLMLTDARLHAMRRSLLHRLGEASALVRLARLRLARRRIDAFDASHLEAQPEAALREIGIPGLVFPSRVHERGEKNGNAQFDEVALGRRVSDDERRHHLSEFVRIAEEQDIALVLIHPSYQDSTPHTCLLTDFARERDIALLDAHPSLHSEDLGSLFRDSFHPGPLGHARLAKALDEFIWPRISDGGG